MGEVASVAQQRSPAVVLPFGQIFRSEIAEAKALGYKAELNFGDTLITVRLVPRTERAKRQAAAAAPEGVADPAIQSSIDTPADAVIPERLDRVREAFAAALVLARDAA